jgi:hypothetical protein
VAAVPFRNTSPLSSPDPHHRLEKSPVPSGVNQTLVRNYTKTKRVQVLPRSIPFTGSVPFCEERLSAVEQMHVP